MHTDVYFVALHDYETQQADEIELLQGDIIRLIDELESGWAMGERVSTGEQGVYPTNFVGPYQQGRSRTRSQESKASSVHFTPGGFDRYVKMIKNRPRRESTRRKPSRSFRVSKSKLKWGENSWSFFEPWRSFRFKDKDQAAKLKRTSQTWAGSLTSILRNPSPERKPTMKPKREERLEKEEERGRKREKKYVSTMEVPIRGGSQSPGRHFYQDEDYFKDGRIKGSKGLNLITQHNHPQPSPKSSQQQQSPAIPRKPPVTAEMKMEEIQHMVDFDSDEDFDDSILEGDFDDFDEQSHLYHETDSFYFQDEFQEHLQMEYDHDDGVEEEEEEQMDDYEVKVAQQERHLPTRPNVHFGEEYNELESVQYEDDDNGEEVNGDDIQYRAVEKKIIEPKGPRWSQPRIEGVAQTSGVKWGEPRYESIEFPWNRPGSKAPKVKGQNFRRNDHIHGKPAWLEDKPKFSRRIVAPLPKPEKTPSKPARQPKQPRQAKIVKVVKNSRGEIVKMIDEKGKMFVSPAYQKRKAKKTLQQQAYSTLQSVQSIDDSSMATSEAMKSTKSTKSTKSEKKSDLPVKIKTPQEHQVAALRTARVVTGETLIDPTKLQNRHQTQQPMTRQQQIAFIKQQTRLAKKIAIRPHIAESEVLAALHDLERSQPEARAPSKATAVVATDDDQITNFPLHSLFPLSERCRDIMVMRELANPVIFYSSTMCSISSFLREHKDELSIGDCNAITGSVIVGRLVFGLVAKAADYGCAKPNYLAVTSTNVINTFKEQLPNCLSPPTKKDFARLALDTRKFLAERNMSDLVKITSVSNQKQFRSALRKAMIACELPMGEQAKLELLFQSISLEKLEILAKKATDQFIVKFNKPKGIEPNTIHINKKEVDALITQEMLKCLKI